MRKFFTAGLFGIASAIALGMPGAAYAECGEVSITEMNWASSQIITEVSKFLMEQGYGCKVEKVPSATTTSVASLAETGEPDIVTELWLNSTGDVYAKLEAEGKVSRLADVFNPGGVEGWWIPSYLAEAHLTPADWAVIDASFLDHDDPVFGDKPRDEFRGLLAAIAARAPAPHGYGRS